MRVVPALLLLGSLVHCSAANPASRPRRAIAPREVAPSRPGSPPALEARRVAVVPGGTFGPYLVRTDDRSLVIWAVTDAEQAGDVGWFSSLVPARGAPGAPRRLADASTELELVAVRPAGPEGFVALSTRKRATGDTIEALLLGEGGELRRGGITLATERQGVVWLGAHARADGTDVLWAERRAGGARLMLVGLDADGRAGREQELASAVVAWQVVDTPERGLAIGIVDAAAEKGRVELLIRSPEGALKRSVVSDTRDTSPDLDLVYVGGAYVLAWTARGQGDPRIMLARVEASGALLEAPRPASPGLGGEALVRLVPPATPSGAAYLAYESLGGRPADGRSITIARLTPEAALGEQVRLSVASPDQLPELAATPSGLAALTLAPTCPKATSGDAPASAGSACSSTAPVFVELGPTLDLIAAEPIRLKPLDGAAAMAAWDLDCKGGRCVALAAVPTTPAPVFAVDLEARSKRFSAPVEKVEPDRPPRAVALDDIATLDSLSDLAVTRLGDAELCAWVSYFDPSAPWEKPAKPAPDGRYAPVRAVLGAASVTGGPPFTTETISYRAHSLGGVALAPAVSGKEALLVWTALDNGAPQVFATTLDARPRRLKQRMLTRTKGDKSDVAAAALSDGWLVAWVDERSGDPEVYATKLGKALEQASPEVRLTSAAGAASDVALVVHGDRAIIAWNDAREMTDATPYAATLSIKDARVIAPPQRLVATATRATAFALAGATTVGGPLAVGWIEGSRDDSTEPGLRLGALTAEGRLQGEPLRTGAARGAATGLALDCATGTCRAAVSVDAGGMTALDLVPDVGLGASKRVLNTQSAPGRAPRLVLLGSHIYFGDLDDTGRARVRRATLEW